MPKCPKCRRDTVTGTRSDGTTLALDMVPNTYAYLEEPWLPVEGGRIGLAMAFVVHEAVCPTLLRQRDDQRTAYRARHAVRPATGEGG